MTRLFYLLPLLLAVLPDQTAVAQPLTPSAILSERDRARAVDDLLEDRFTNLLPQLMRRNGLDMWIIISREYNRNGEP